MVISAHDIRASVHQTHMSNSSPASSRASSPVTAHPDVSPYDTTTPTAGPSSSRYHFSWDPSERRGPESVSGTTAYGQDYFAAAPTGLGFHFGGSTASLNLGALPSEWSSSKHGFHGKQFSYVDAPLASSFHFKRYLLSSIIHTNGKLRQKLILPCLLWFLQHFHVCGAKISTRI